MGWLRRVFASDASRPADSTAPETSSVKASPESSNSRKARIAQPAQNDRIECEARQYQAEIEKISLASLDCGEYCEHIAEIFSAMELHEDMGLTQIRRGLRRACETRMVAQDVELSDYFDTRWQEILAEAVADVLGVASKRQTANRRYSGMPYVDWISDWPWSFELWRCNANGSPEKLLGTHEESQASVAATMLLDVRTFRLLTSMLAESAGRNPDDPLIGLAIAECAGRIRVEAGREGSELSGEEVHQLIAEAQSIVAVVDLLEAGDIDFYDLVSLSDGEQARSFDSRRSSANCGYEESSDSAFSVSQRKGSSSMVAAANKLSAAEVDGLLQQARRCLQGRGAKALARESVNEVCENVKVEADLAPSSVLWRYGNQILSCAVESALERRTDSLLLAQEEQVERARKIITRLEWMRLNKVWDERGGGSAFRERFSGKEAPSVREFISYLQEKGSPLDAPLVRREKPSFVAFTDFRVYEEQARKWMVWLGFEDAVLTPPGPDGGIDIVSDVAVAQVKLYASQIGIDKINEFAGASAPYPGRIMIYFAASGYTKSAVARADQAQSEIALFVLTQFDIEPVNEVAQNLYAYADRL